MPGGCLALWTVGSEDAAGDPPRIVYQQRRKSMGLARTTTFWSRILAQTSRIGRRLFGAHRKPKSLATDHRPDDRRRPIGRGPVGPLSTAAGVRGRHRCTTTERCPTRGDSCWRGTLPLALSRYSAVGLTRQMNGGSESDENDGADEHRLSQSSNTSTPCIKQRKTHGRSAPNTPST